MKLGIMQPYLFPWIGYFQLVNFVDELVIYDDVQYIKNGWINRNRLLINGQPRYFTLPVLKASHALPICARRFASSFERDKRRTLKSLEMAYAAAPHFRDTLNLVQDCFACRDDNVAAFVSHTLSKVCEALGIETLLRRSSELEHSSTTRGQNRVLDICRTLHASHYVNAIGGTDLYEGDAFAQNGQRLSFLQTRDIAYQQFQNTFRPNLSIIDVMMFNDRDQIAALLHEFDLKSPQS
jgi:WbqC-like protein family